MSTSNHQVMETLKDASRYLESLINHERRPEFAYARLDLRPIQALLDRLGRPEDNLSMIHVAGSKGKGSTCLFAEAILLELGESVGTFTSPHLESWVERFRIDGQPVSSDALVAAVRRVRPIVDDLKQGPTETLPSFFDATTAVAFLLFAEAGVDRALIEVGLGGRLDSTNAIHPAVTCVTSIELEHADKLGDTETKIAFEKAGILKPGVPVVLGKLREEADAVVRARAEAVDASVIARGEHFTVDAKQAEEGGRDLVFRASRPSGGAFEVSATLRMHGEAATDNAALAIACVRALGSHSDEALCKASRHGLARCMLPARIEVLQNDERVIVDAAHTAESARVLAAALDTLAPNGIELLLSVSSDKNLSALLDRLLPRTRRVWVTRAEPLRSIDVDVLAESIRAHTPGMSIAIVEDPEAASRCARAALESDRKLCVAGSIYLAGAVRRALGDAPLSPGDSPFPIRLATAAEALLLPDIERRAAALFSPSDVSPELADDPTPANIYQGAQRDRRVFVARGPSDRVVGFAHLIWLDGQAHLEELDVDPDFGRLGIGGRLVLAACDWARRQGCHGITLSTFRDVPWNAPFYSRLGFQAIQESELSPGLAQLREKERRIGLDPAKRVMMNRKLFATKPKP